MVATEAATWVATGAASATWHTDLTESMRHLAMRIGGESHAKLLLSCAHSASAMWNGGNQWAGWAAFISFFRTIAKLDLPYEAWDHYEVLASRAGPRIIHPDFCMISDRPALLTVDSQNRPHNDDGPFCQWRDGTALYSVHGIRVPAWVIEQPERLTVDAIHAETNEEVRRVMVERYGIARYVRDAQFDILDSDLDPLGLPRRLLRRAEVTVVELTNSTVDADGTRRKYFIPCHPELRPLLSDSDLGEPQKLTALNAVASTYGLRGEEYVLSDET
jgi:hypothetical protein